MTVLIPRRLLRCIRAERCHPDCSARRFFLQRRGIHLVFWQHTRPGCSVQLAVLHFWYPTHRLDYTIWPLQVVCHCQASHRAGRDESTRPRSETDFRRSNVHRWNVRRCWYSSARDHDRQRRQCDVPGRRLRGAFGAVLKDRLCKREEYARKEVQYVRNNCHSGKTAKMRPCMNDQ